MTNLVQECLTRLDFHLFLFLGILLYNNRAIAEEEADELSSGGQGGRMCIGGKERGRSRNGQREKLKAWKSNSEFASVSQGGARGSPFFLLAT